MESKKQLKTTKNKLVVSKLDNKMKQKTKSN